MKSLLIALMIFTFLGKAHAQGLPSCLGLYQNEKIKRDIKRDKYNDRFNDRKNADLTLNEAIALAGAAVALTISLPVGAVIFATPAVIHLAKNLPNKEERVLLLSENYHDKLSKFVKKLQKDISPKITQEEVSQIIRNGFDSNKFCANYPDVSSRREIKQLIRAELKEKYL